MRPPLAAASSVWARRQEFVVHLDMAPWPGAAHLAAAAVERAFWARTLLHPAMQPSGALGAAAAAAGSAPVRGLDVAPKLGAVSCIAAAPCGKFLAAGTERGAVAVWDLRERSPREPLFQVGL
jgi:hypothetical protein